MPQPLTSGPAPEVVGVTPGGAPIAVDVSDDEVTLLFLTSDCKECKRCWERAAGAAKTGEGALTIIITPDPATDSRRSVARQAPAGATVVMSSAAWHCYGVTKAPWRVQVRSGAIASSGPAVQT